MVKNGNGANRLGAWLGIGASAAVFVTAMVTGFYSLSTMAYKVNDNTVKLESMDTAIRADQEIIRSLQLKINSLEVSLNEVETQFCADDQMRNIMHATDLRIQSLLWQKSFADTKLPTDNAYYPSICNRKATP